MNHLTLTPEQLQTIQQNNGEIEVRTPTGETLGKLTPFTTWELEALERWRQKRDQPRRPGIPSAKVREHLQRLEEIDRVEKLTEERAIELLRRMQAGEAV